MTETEYKHKLDELDRLLNDSNVPMQPHRIWDLLAELADRQSFSAPIRNSLLPSGPVMGLSAMPSTRQPGSASHQA
jgi:hypothetical protein